METVLKNKCKILEKVWPWAYVLGKKIDILFKNYQSKYKIYNLELQEKINCKMRKYFFPNSFDTYSIVKLTKK